MSTSISSAEPAKLQTYSNIACSLDAEISADAGRLSSALASFESSCREPGFAVNAAYAANNMSRFANDARPTDEWVAMVGRDFLWADGGALVGTFTPSLDPKFTGAQGAIGNIEEALLPDGALEELIGLLAAVTANDPTSIKSALLQLGRLGNMLVGNMNAGGVGLMKSAYRWFRNSPFNTGLEWLDTPLGKGVLVAIGSVMEANRDWKNETYGKDLAKTIGVNAGDGLMQYGILMNPIGAKILLVNSLVQIGGDLSIAHDKFIADFISTNTDTRDILLGDAARREDALDKMDLTNITKELSEAIYDGYAAALSDYGTTIRDVSSGVQNIINNPSWSNVAALGSTLSPQRISSLSTQSMMFTPMGLVSPLVTTQAGRDGLLDTGKAAVSVLDGLADWTVASNLSNHNKGIAIATKVTNSLPITNQMKDNINRMSLMIMQQNSEFADRFTNFVNI